MKKNGNGNSEKLRMRQRKFLKAKLEGKSSYRAALDAGYSDQTARHAEREITAKPNVAGAFIAILEKAGLTDELLAKRLREGISAKETKLFPTLVRAETPTGDDIPRVDLIDYPTRHTYLATALKIKGHLADRLEVKGELAIAELLDASFKVQKNEE